MPWSRRHLLRTSLAASTAALIGCQTKRQSLAPLQDGPDGPDSEDGRRPANFEGDGSDFLALQGYCDGVPPVDAAELAQRRDRARMALQRAGASVLVCEAGLHLRYFTGIRWHVSERPVLLGLAADGRDLMVVPAFEEQTFLERLDVPVKLAMWHEHENWAQVFARTLQLLHGPTKPVALDPNLRHFVADRLQQVLPCQPGQAVVDSVRMVKTPVEITRLRRANEASKAAIAAAARHVEVGMNQGQIAALMERAQVQAGLRDVWVIALIGPNAAFPHGTQQDRRLTAGDLVLIDTGGDLHGYQSDISRTFSCTPVDALIQDAFASTLAAQSAAIELLRPGLSCAAIDQCARFELAKRGWGGAYRRMTHRLGHGIGVQGHEAPYLVPDNPQILTPGMTMSVEPGIYVPGRFGVRIEDIIVITQNGCEVFGPRCLSLEQPFGSAT